MGFLSRISNTATVDEITNSVLRVKTIESDQYGDYYCKASNKMGHSEARINLYGKFLPKQIQNHGELLQRIWKVANGFYFLQV